MNTFAFNHLQGEIVSKVAPERFQKSSVYSIDSMEFQFFEALNVLGFKKRNLSKVLQRALNAEENAFENLEDTLVNFIVKISYIDDINFVHSREALESKFRTAQVLDNPHYESIHGFIVYKPVESATLLL